MPLKLFEHKKRSFVSGDNPRKLIVKKQKRQIVPEDNMDGSGIIETGKTAFKFGSSLLEKVDAFKKLASVAGSVYGSEIVNGWKNSYMENYVKNPNYRPGYPDERHLWLPTEYGMTKGNYIGPHTALEKRLARGDPGINDIDKAAKQHDIAYRDARTKSDIRTADEKMIKAVRKAKDSGPKTKKLVEKGLNLKILSEKVGLMEPTDFTNLTLSGEGKKSLSEQRNKGLTEKKKKEKKEKKYKSGERLRKTLLSKHST